MGVRLKTSEEQACHLFESFQKLLPCLCLFISFSLERLQLDAAFLSSLLNSICAMFSAAIFAGVDVLLKFFLNVRS